MPRDKSLSHEKVKQAIKEEFLEKGYENASIRSIGARAGMTSAGLYRHYVDKEAMFNAMVDPLIDSIKGTSYTNYFLDAGKEYKLRVRAVTKLDDEKVYGNYASVTVKTLYKAAKLKSVSSTANGKVTVKWTPKTENTKGYIIHYSKTKDFNPKKSHKIKKKTVDNITLSGFSSKTRYYFRVKSYNYVNGKYFFSKYSTVKSVVIK